MLTNCVRSDFYRFLQAMQDENGEVILVGKCWSPDVTDWNKEVLQIPKREEDKGNYYSFKIFLRF